MDKKIKTFFLIFMAFMVNGRADWNLSGGCGIGLDDLAVFCEGWLDPYDMADFADFAALWGTETSRYYCNDTAPTAANVAAAACQYEPQVITLAGSDDGKPRPPGHLKYWITSLPAGAVVQNRLVREPDRFTAAGWLTGFSPQLIFATGTAGEHVIGYRAWDGMAWSNTATVTVTATACAMDAISVGPGGSVSIPDGAYLDAADGWGVDFWIQTRQTDVVILSKRAAGAGYVIELAGGCPRITLYDGSTSITATGTWAVNTGDWREVGATFNLSGSDYTLSVQTESVTETVTGSGTFDPFANAEPLVIGEVWNLDSLRFYAGITDPEAIGNLIQGWYQRTDTAEAASMGFYPYSAVWFKMDEGTGATITDAKAGYVGTFAGEVDWHNLYWDWDQNGMQTIAEF
jgi:hypothetical protein